MENIGGGGAVYHLPVAIHQLLQSKVFATEILAVIGVVTATLPITAQITTDTYIWAILRMYTNLKFGQHM